MPKKEVFLMSSKQSSEQRNLSRRIAGVTMPIGRKRIKWSRNWPCLCGKDKKYKQCCMNEIEQLTRSDGNAIVGELDSEVQSMIDEIRQDEDNGGGKSSG